MGTAETKNRLSENGYNNISVLSELDTPSIHLLQLLHSLPPSSHQADCSFFSFFFFFFSELFVTYFG